jgi:peptide/nickel transport system ATP-binding protein
MFGGLLTLIPLWIVIPVLGKQVDKTIVKVTDFEQPAGCEDTPEQKVLLSLRDVKMYFPVMGGLFGEPSYVHAVDGVSFDVRQGEVFGIAGESGSGKTTTGRIAIRLLEPTAGEVFFDDIRITHLAEPQMRKLRRQMQPIFQDPFASMNPRMTLGQGIGHGLKIHHIGANAQERRDLVMDMMGRVGLVPPEAYYGRYPHQISGGQRQRVVIARSLVLHPELIMADEPIAMADVSVRAVLLDLMKELQQEMNLTYLFITHDLATAKYICDRIAIMYLGQIVEMGDIKSVYRNPLHPYTEALLAAVPVPDPRHRRTKPMPKGEIPNPINPPSGCRFHPRCPIAQEVCGQLVPVLLPGKDDPNHVAACHLRTGDFQHLDPTR